MCTLRCTFSQTILQCTRVLNTLQQRKTEPGRDDIPNRKFSKSFGITAESQGSKKNSLGSTRNLYQNLFQTILSKFGFFYFQVGGGVGHSPISIIDVLLICI